MNKPVQNFALGDMRRLQSVLLDKPKKAARQKAATKHRPMDREDCDVMAACTVALAVLIFFAWLGWV